MLVAALSVLVVVFLLLAFLGWALVFGQSSTIDDLKRQLSDLQYQFNKVKEHNEYLQDKLVPVLIEKLPLGWQAVYEKAPHITVVGRTFDEMTANFFREIYGINRNFTFTFQGGVHIPMNPHHTEGPHHVVH